MGRGNLRRPVLRLPGGRPIRASEGHRFNKHKLLLDPYATALSGSPRWDFLKAKGYDVNSSLGPLSFSTTDDAHSVPRCIITGNRFDWQDDVPPRTSWSDTIIYETHVKGFTIHPSSGVDHPGTFDGIIEKIPYLKRARRYRHRVPPHTGVQRAGNRQCQPPHRRPLVNYWGYSTVSFFAPKASYGGDGPEGGQVIEFKKMVKELHRAGIEVILDVVFNHTAEGDETGPTISFRSLDNMVYYMLETDRACYQNYLGMRQHGQLQPPNRAPVHHRLPHLLGGQDAR